MSKTLSKLLYTFFALAILVVSTLAFAGNWHITGSLHTGRDFHTATLLPNGKVLVAAGGFGGAEGETRGYSQNAELYDPDSGTWAYTGSLGTPRETHTATLLPNGKVLVVGGD